ncbi:MAG: hypothetical protein NTY75_01770 [Candidatus Shapirobacteria bacterium]|nr:hypothetical protein [Candidatus Shapirobacteria bacterium]
MPFVHPAYAQCPICIVTVGGGMLLAEKLGIDSLLIGIWISALNTAIAFYLASKFKLKLLNNPWLLSFLFLFLILFYFQVTNQIGNPANKLLGIDKTVFGQVLGLIAMFIGNFIYGFTKYKNGDKVLFPYSKVVFPVVAVLLVTIIFKLVFNL